MDLRFIVDTQLPPTLAEFLRRRDYDASHVTDYPNGAYTADDEIIEIAKRENRIVITKDSDFWDYFILRGYPPAVLFLQLGNIKNQELFSIMNNRLKTIDALFTEDVNRLIIVQRKNILLY